MKRLGNLIIDRDLVTTRTEAMLPVLDSTGSAREESARRGIDVGLTLVFSLSL